MPLERDSKLALKLAFFLKRPEDPPFRGGDESP